MGAGRWLTPASDATGSTFVQLLRVAVPPPVFTAIVSISPLRQVVDATRTLVWFAITSLIAVTSRCANRWRGLPGPDPVAHGVTGGYM